MATTKSTLRPNCSSHSDIHHQRHVTFNLPERPPRNALWSFDQLVPAHPSLGQVDDTTIALANTLAYLDGDAGIPRSLLTRAGCTRRTWGSHGEPADVTPAESGIDPALLVILSSAERLQTAINQLEFQGFLDTDNDGDVLWMHAGTRAMCKQRLLDPYRWMVQAMLLVCHAFPRDRYLEEHFSDLGRVYIPHVRHISQHYDAIDAANQVPIALRQAMADTLVASSHLSSMTWKKDAIDRAEKIAASLAVRDECLDMMILARKTDIGRLTGLFTLVNLSNFPTDNKKLNALFGEIFLVQSSDCLQNKSDTKTALSILQNIQPVDRNHISTLEELVLQKKAIYWGRIYRFEGRFKEARQVLEAVYNNPGTFPEGVVSVSASSWDLISHLAATLCELGEPTQAEVIISTKLDTLHRSPTMRKGNPILRLKLALAEAALQQGEYWRAQDIYWDLTRHIGISQGQSESMSVCRLNIGLARVQHVQGNWIAALKHWERALWVYDNNPELKGFGLVVVYASIAFIKNRMGDAHGAARYEAKARELFSFTGRRHWFTSLGTVWLDQVMPGLDDGSKDVPQKDVLSVKNS